MLQHKAVMSIDQQSLKIIKAGTESIDPTIVSVVCALHPEIANLCIIMKFTPSFNDSSFNDSSFNRDKKAYYCYGKDHDDRFFGDVHVIDDAGRLQLFI